MSSLSSTEARTEDTGRKLSKTKKGIPRIQISLSSSNMTAASTAAAATAASKKKRTTAATNNSNSNSTDPGTGPSPPVPVLSKSVRKALKNQTLNFKINVECTSLKISPSGNFLWGGFSDGTLRVWDLSGTFHVEDDDRDIIEKYVSSSRKNGRRGQGGKMDVLVNSKLTQGYGAVACQIHARGVHTDLITTIDISDDEQYVFMGVSRGATEVYAVYIGDLELAVHQHQHQINIINNSKKKLSEQQQASSEQGEGSTVPAPAAVSTNRNILDHLKVYCHSDAKLKGFGACATINKKTTADEEHRNDDADTTTDDQHMVTSLALSKTTTSSYLLLTGKGIKNIHIWKFVPPKYHPRSSSFGYDEYNNDDNDENNNSTNEVVVKDDNGRWEQVYDTSTNGNTINLLRFYRTTTPDHTLFAVSKSDTQKIRLWDMSYEEEEETGNAVIEHEQHHQEQPQQRCNIRPKRPPYRDVANSQSALEIAGGVGICGGGHMYNEMSIVLLDRPNDPFNHTELAIPSSSSSSSSLGGGIGGGGGRSRRGEMKVVVNVATSQYDSSHALLELDDGSLVGYSAGTSSYGGNSSASSSSGSVGGSGGNNGAVGHGLPRLAIASPETTGIPSLPADFWSRCICLANISGVVIAASSLYNPNTNKGQLVIRALGGLKKKRGSNIVEKRQQQQHHRSRSQSSRQPKGTESKSQQQRSSHQKLVRKKFDSSPVAVAALSPPPPQQSSSQRRMELSPIVVDSKALRDAVSGPASIPARKNKKLAPIEDSNSQFTASAAATHVSPDSKEANQNNRSSNDVMGTPAQNKDNTKHVTVTKNTTTMMTSTDHSSSSPESMDGLPDISMYLQPKRIVMQQKQKQTNGSTKKCNASASLSDKAKKKVETKNSVGSINDNSFDGVSLFKLNTIGSIPITDVKQKTNFRGNSSSAHVTRKPLLLTSPKASSSSMTNLVVPSSPIVASGSKKKRGRPTASSKNTKKGSIEQRHTNAEVNTALFMTALADRKQQTKSNANKLDNDDTKSASNHVVATISPNPFVSITSAPMISCKDISTSDIVNNAKSSKSNLVLKSSTAKATDTVMMPPPQPSVQQPQQQQPSKEATLHEKIGEQYKQLRMFLQDVTDRSMGLIHARNLRGPVPSALVEDEDRDHLSAYSNLLQEHRAAHNYLQRGLLRSAETTLRLLMESSISAEEARSELKQTIKKYEEILYDTIHRQELERLAVVAQHPNTTSNLIRGSGRYQFSRDAVCDDSTSVLSLAADQSTHSTTNKPYPCQAAFEKVEDICAAIARPVGRPKAR